MSPVMTLAILAILQGSAFGALKYLKGADGLIYFIDDGAVPVPLADAENTCKTGNAQLAIIETVKQRDFLANHVEIVDNWYWTAGQDSQTASQFAWVSENSQGPDATVTDVLELDGAKPFSCLVFKKGKFGIKKCATDLALPLCYDKVDNTNRISHRGGRNFTRY